MYWLSPHFCHTLTSLIGCPAFNSFTCSLFTFSPLISGSVSRRWHTFDQTRHGFVLDSFRSAGLVIGDWTQTQTLFFGYIQRKSHFLRSSSTAKVRWVWTEGFNNFGLCLNVCWFFCNSRQRCLCSCGLFVSMCARSRVRACTCVWGTSVAAACTNLRSQLGALVIIQPLPLLQH